MANRDDTSTVVMRKSIIARLRACKCHPRETMEDVIVRLLTAQEELDAQRQ